MKWEMVRLGDLCEKISTVNPAVLYANSQFVYLDIASVDSEKKIVSYENKVTGVDAPSRARQIVSSGDVLVSTVRPNLNAVAFISRDETELIASTGFCVLRTTAQKLDNRYLFYWVRTKKFIKRMIERATGASYPAVSDAIIKDSKIPLPPLPIQQKIAAILDAADTLRQKDKALLDHYDALLQSTFHQMFGDPVKNDMGWDVKRFIEAGKLDRGVSKHRPRNAPELLGGKYPLIQTGDVANSEGYIYKYKATYSEIGLKQSKLWPIGTLCITIAANIAKTGILQIEACFPDSVVGFLPNESTNVMYVQTWLSHLQKSLEENAPESAQKNINLEILRNIPIPLPPLPLQTKFAEIAQNIQQQKAMVKEQAAQSEALFQSLLHEAFSGELV